MGYPIYPPFIFLVFDMTFKKIPSLTMSGYLSTAEQAINATFSYYLESEYSQSTVFRGQVLSLPYRLEQFSGDERNLVEAVSEDIENLFRRSFDGCTANVYATTSPDGEDKFDLNIGAAILNNGVEYSLNRVLKISNNKLVSQ